MQNQKYEGERNYEAELSSDIVSESLHGDAGDSHGVSDHHSGDRDYVPWSEGEDF